jgi:hypothetical protein
MEGVARRAAPYRVLQLGCLACLLAQRLLWLLLWLRRLLHRLLTILMSAIPLVSSDARHCGGVCRWAWCAGGQTAVRRRGIDLHAAPYLLVP